MTQVFGQRLQLEMERVIELGVNGGSGGREGDVRLARPKAARIVEEREREPTTEEDTCKAQTERDETDGSKEGEEAETYAAGVQADVPQTKPVMVCRPKVGERIQGGGFLGAWRKMRA